MQKVNCEDVITKVPAMATQVRCIRGNEIVSIKAQGRLACLEIYIWVVTILTEVVLPRGEFVKDCSQLWSWFSALGSQSAISPSHTLDSHFTVGCWGWMGMENKTIQVEESKLILKGFQKRLYNTGCSILLSWPPNH